MVDLLLGVDIFSDVLLHGRWHGPPGSPTALETRFRWVIAGAVECEAPQTQLVSNHATTVSTDDLLRQFWETEEFVPGKAPHSVNEQFVMTHFQREHHRDEMGRFIVPLPFRVDAEPLGESRSTVVRRFLSLERSLHSRRKFQELNEVVKEYFESGHAELVPECDLNKPCHSVFYLPIHAVFKESSTTSSVRCISEVIYWHLSQRPASGWPYGAFIAS